MKEKTTGAEAASRVCYETMDAHARGCIQRWLQELLEAEVTEFLGRSKSQRRAELEVGVYTLQEGIIPADLDLFEQYWIDQFADLLNIVGNKAGKVDTSVAKQIKAAIRAQLESSRAVDRP